MARRIPDELTNVDPIDVPATDAPPLLWCSYGHHWRPPEAFHRDRSCTSGRKWSCIECGRKRRGTPEPEVLPEGKRRCRNCDTVKPIGQFRWMRKSGGRGVSYGHDPLCIPCRQEVRAYYNKKQQAKLDRTERNKKRRDSYKRMQRDKVPYRKMLFARLRHFLQDLIDRGYTYRTIGDHIDRSPDVVNRWMIRDSLPYQSTLEDVVPKLEALSYHAESTAALPQPETEPDESDDLLSWAEWAKQRQNAAD